MHVSPDDRRLLLLLSSERSGSTLLSVMLGGHPRIVAPPELFLLRYPDFLAWRAAKPLALRSLEQFFRLVGQPKTGGEIDTRCAGWSTTRVYHWLFRHIRPDGWLLDKTPAYAADPQALERSRPLAVFYVWLVRHPLAVVDSDLRLKDGRRPGWWRAMRRVRDVAERAVGGGLPRRARARERRWRQQQRNIRAFLGDIPPERQCRVSFEELVHHPRRTLETVCDALGIELVEPMLHPEERARPIPAGIGDPGFHRHTGIEPGTAWDWRRRFDERVLEPETRSLMQELAIRTGSSAHG